MKRKDLTGQRFGFWLVLGFAGNSKNGAALWRCQCACGNIKNVLYESLTGGVSRSCCNYQRKLDAVNPALFWAKVEIAGPDDCWLWKARRDRDGYGIASWAGKQGRANRIAYQLKNGPIPDGFVVRHSCDNPPCCNPAHLKPGTTADNQADASARGRLHGPGEKVRGESSGRAKLTREQVLEIRRRAGNRETNVVLAKEFGVSRQLISLIKRREAWAWLAEAGQDAG